MEDVLGENRPRGKGIKENKLHGQVPLCDLNSSDEKYKTLFERFIGLEKANKKLISASKQNAKKFELLFKEKEILQKEHNKEILLRDKLEGLCREQQKLIKAIKNESLEKIREEEVRRKETQAKLLHSINEISATLNKNNEENIKLKEENIEMTNKLMFLAEQYQLREKQLEKVNEQINLETQLNEAKMTKFKMEVAVDKEILFEEKQKALEELITSKKSVQQLQDREKILNEQLAVYSSKHTDFQTSLKRSNDIFTSYKNEIAKMCNNITKMEKEAIDWKTKWERSNSSLIKMVHEKQEKEAHVTKLMLQIQQLQKLIRTFQAERKTLYKVLKDNNIERPSIPVMPPEFVNSQQKPPEVDKLDFMVKNCAELKQTLAKLQNQMNELSSKQDCPASKAINENTNLKQNTRCLEMEDVEPKQDDQDLNQLKTEELDVLILNKSIDTQICDSNEWKKLNVTDEEDIEVEINSNKFIELKINSMKKL